MMRAAISLVWTIYSADLADLRTRLDELIDIGKQILSKLAEL